MSNQIVLLLCTDVIIKEQNILNPNKVRQIIDGLKKLTKVIIKFIIQNIIETLNQIKSEYILLSHFRQMNSIFDNVSKWLNNENLNLLKSSIKNSSDCETLKYYLESNYSTKAFSKLSSCKIEREKSKIYHKILIIFSKIVFFAAFFKKTLNSLKFSLEDEIWAPCDIPYIYQHFIANLCDFQGLNCEKDSLGLDLAKSNRLTNYFNETNNFDEDQKENEQIDFNNNGSSPFSLRKDVSFTKEANELKKTNGSNLIRIMKNELYIDENKFMVGDSTLNLIKSLYDLLLFLQLSPINSNEIVAKIFEIIKVYKNLLVSCNNFCFILVL